MRGETESRPLKAVFFSHSAQLAGAEHVLLELVEDLGARGVLCWVVLPREGPLRERLTRTGARLVTAELPWWGGTSVPPLDELRRSTAAGARRLLLGVLPRLRRIDPDAVFTQTLVLPWGALAAHLLGKPHLWYVTELGEGPSGLRFYFPFAKVLEAVATSERVLLISRAVQEQLFPGGGARLAMLPGRVRLPSALPQPALTGWPGVDRPARLGVFGGVSDAKGQGTAIEALALLRARGVHSELMLVGPETTAPAAARFRRLAAERGVADAVLFAGPFDDQYEPMATTDVVLVPSRSESFSRVAVEALLLERPLVATGVGGIPERVRDGETGLLVRPDDPRELADRIMELLSDPDHAREMAARGRREMLERLAQEDFGGTALRHLEATVAHSLGARALPEVLAAPLVLLAEEESRLREQCGAQLEREQDMLRRRASLELRLSNATDELQHQLELEGRRREGLAAELEQQRQAAEGLERRLRQEGERRRELEAVLEQIHRSRGWRLLERLWSLVDRCFPRGSARRRWWYGERRS